MTEPANRRSPAVQQALAAFDDYLARAPGGTLLPSERELAKRFGVSRTTLRSAIARLALEGRLEVRHGLGTFVTSPVAGGAAADSFSPRDDARCDPKEIAEIYALLTVELTRLAAERAKSGALEDVAAAVAGGGGAFIAAIAVASGNSCATTLIERLQQTVLANGQRLEDHSPTGGELLLAMRRTVHAAIAESDPHAAAGAMALYMANWRRSAGLG